MALIKAVNLHKVFILEIGVKKETVDQDIKGKMQTLREYIDVTKSITVLSGIDFSIEEGDYIVIMGPSGSGKTTLLNMLSAIDIPTKGTVHINDQLTRNLSDNKLANIRYKYIGFDFQNFYFLEELSVRHNIASPLVMQEEDESMIIERVNEIAEQLGIRDLLDKYPKQCSGGQKQKIALARALVTHPKIIVADEPTGNLDSNNANMLMQIFDELNHKGKTILMVTHDCWIASYAKKVLYFKDGKIVEMLVRKDGISKEEFFLEVLDLNSKHN